MKIEINEIQFEALLEMADVTLRSTGLKHANAINSIMQVLDEAVKAQAKDSEHESKS